MLVGDYLCQDEQEIFTWLRMNKIAYKGLKAGRYLCTRTPTTPILILRFLHLKVRGLQKVYQKQVFSTSKRRDLIHEEYFLLFGNICRVLDVYERVMEYPCAHYRHQKRTIYAHVKPLWREERASFTIHRFWSDQKRRSWLSVMKEKKGPYRELKTMFSLRDLPRWYRHEYHEKVIRFFLKSGNIVQTKPRAVFMFGLPGSGKNWALSKHRTSGAVIIDVDSIRALLPKYWNAMMHCKTSTVDWIQMMTKECQSIAKGIWSEALQKRYSITWNGTGKNVEKYSSLLKEANQAGYVTELRYIWVPFDLAKKRVGQRHLQIGRHVPLHVIQEAATQIPHTFRTLSPFVHCARIYSNVQKSPRLLWDKHQGWLSTKEDRTSICDLPPL